MNTPKKTGRSKQAKARKLGETQTYRVFVIGQTWEGFQGTYQYSFNTEPTEQQINDKAGDFRSLSDYQVTLVRHIQYSDGDRHIVKITRDWASPDSVDIYCDANGC